MGKKILDGFSVQAPVPLDDRTEVETQQGLEALNKRAYDGMVVYCKANNIHYAYNAEYDIWEWAKIESIN